MNPIVKQANDITEDALRRSEESHRALIEALPDIIMRFDREGRHLFVSENVNNVVGITAAQFINKTHRELGFPDAMCTMWEREILRVFSTGKPHETDFSFEGTHGLTWFNWRLVPEFGDDGATRSVLSISRDITESKRSAQLATESPFYLKKAEESLRYADLRLEAFWNIATMQEADTHTICDDTLRSIVKMTGSNYGFFGFINEDETVMTIHAWSGEAMKGCTMVDKPMHFPIADAGVWGEAVRRRKPFILNQYPAGHPAKKGLPQGHVSLTNLMVVPIFSHGRIVSLAAVANRPADYTEEDARQLKALVENIWAIIDRKVAEEALRESQKRLELAALSAHLGIWDWDIVNNKMTWDNQMYRLYGITGATAYSGIEIWQNGLHPDDRDFAWEACQAAMRGESKYDIEFRVLHPDGAIRHIKADGLVIRDSSGTAIRMIGVNHDITERKLAQEKIRAKDLEFKKLSANVPDLIFQFTRRPDGSYCVPIASEGIKNIFGCAPEDVVDNYTPIASVIHPDDAARVIADIEYSAEHLTYFTCEFRVHIPGRAVQWIYSRSAPERLPDGNITWYGFNTDITARKRMEEELQKTQKLESLGVLAGGIAHDFNNLMGGIFGYIDMASGESNDEKVIRYLSKAMNTIDRAKGLTAQLLTFAKGGAPIQEVGYLFPFVQENAQFALSGAHVSCRFDVAAALWPCSFDRNQIGQVIDNLVINAQQSMPAGGTIEVTARNVTLAEKEHPILPRGDYVRISVKDCGIGIPKELLPRIFDPFFTTKTKGHGLGLATCYSIIKRHAGCIDVESEPGTGSTFSMYLPASTEAAVSLVNKAPEIHCGGGTFLIMDDEEVMRDTIGAMLRSLGYTVVCTASGEDAVDFYATELKQNRSVAAMVFDLTVPGGMGGEAAIEEIRKFDPHTPAFVASGYADDPVMKNPTAFGFTASICKPFRKSELSDMLNRFMAPQK